MLAVRYIAPVPLLLLYLSTTIRWAPLLTSAPSRSAPGPHMMTGAHAHISYLQYARIHTTSTTLFTSHHRHCMLWSAPCYVPAPTGRPLRRVLHPSTLYRTHLHKTAAVFTCLPDIILNNQYTKSTNFDLLRTP